MKQSVFPGAAAAAAALLTAALGVSACGSTATSAPAHTAPATPTATSAPASPPASTSESIKGIPFYQPSTVHSKTDTSATLTSPDPVTKVSDYYVKVLDTDGWMTVSKSITPHSGNLTVKKSGQGATISVAPSGSGSLISISTYPT